MELEKEKVIERIREAKESKSSKIIIYIIKKVEKFI